MFREIIQFSALKGKLKSGVKAISQSALIARIRAALENNTSVNLHRSPIALSFEGEDLVIEGRVEHIGAKKIALEIAAITAPGIGIVDRLHVTPAEPMGDRETCDYVVKVLLEEPALEHCLIHSRQPNRLESHRKTVSEPTGTIVVKVDNGVVTLNGEVPSLSHKRLAGVLTWWVPGCCDVVNGLEEAPREMDNDDELTDAVRLVLEKDPFVNATNIRVSAKDWIVRLGGLVPNETMKQMAERDVWYVLGVKNVVNNIQVKW